MGIELSRATIAVEHVRIRCARPFETVRAALVSDLPPLDPELERHLKAARTQTIADLRANGPKLWLFAIGNHGALISAEGREAKALQFTIGNPLTAERMTRHHLGASLYAPLRVALYEDAAGQAWFEYDRPSSLFGQFGDARVTAVSQELDEELEAVLCRVAG